MNFTKVLLKYKQGPIISKILNKKVNQQEYHVALMCWSSRIAGPCTCVDTWVLHGILVQGGL